MTPLQRTLNSRDLGLFYGLVCEGPYVKDSSKDSFGQGPYVKIIKKPLVLLCFRSLRRKKPMVLLCFRSTMLKKHWCSCDFVPKGYKTIGFTAFSSENIEKPLVLQAKPAPTFSLFMKTWSRKSMTTLDELQSGNMLIVVLLAARASFAPKP